MDRAEALLKKHDDFEKTMDAQREKIESVNTLAEALVGDNHYDAKNVSLRQSAVVERWVCISSTMYMDCAGLSFHLVTLHKTVIQRLLGLVRAWQLGPATIADSHSNYMGVLIPQS